jgi:predicted small integral membrane protein
LGAVWRRADQADRGYVARHAAPNGKPFHAEISTSTLSGDAALCALRRHQGPAGQQGDAAVLQVTRLTSATMLMRVAKIAMVAAIAAWFSLVAFGNITDYGTNFAFVQHVMSMDTLFPTTTITYRAITNPAVHHAIYAVIIATQTVATILCWLGALALLRASRGPARAFNGAKGFAIAGLALGFLLYQLGFITIAGEWFGMWMSQQWNGVPSAYRFLMIMIAVLIFLAIPDGEIDETRSTMRE